MSITYTNKLDHRYMLLYQLTFFEENSPTINIVCLCSKEYFLTRKDTPGALLGFRVTIRPGAMAFYVPPHSPTHRPLSAHHCVLVGQGRSHVRPRRGGLLPPVFEKPREVLFWGPSPSPLSKSTYCLISRLLLKLAFLNLPCAIYAKTILLKCVR